MLPVSNLEAPNLYIADSDPRWEQASEVVKNAFYLSLFSGKEASQPTLVEAELHFGTEKGREDQFLREIRAGQIEYIDGKPYYCALINDPLELLPLLRSFSPWLTILPGDHDLDKRLRENLRQMQDQLDGNHWEPSQLADVNLTKKAVKVAHGTTDNDEVLQAQKQKLLSPFQSRLMQFCLDLLTCAANPHPPTEETITALSKKYGIYVPQDIIRLLQASEFLEPGNELVLFHTHSNPPTLPMSQVEQEYLQYILSSDNVPEVSLFLSDDTKQALVDPCSQCPNRPNCENREECDIRRQGELLKQPPDWARHIQPFTAPGMRPPHDSEAKGFRLLLQAIRERKLIHYRYRVTGKSEWQDGECLPWKLEYSAYDRRWWIILYHLEDKRTIKAALNHLKNIQLGDPVNRETLPDSQIDAAIEQLRMAEPVELQIRNEHNALLRCFTVFENQEVCESSRPAKDGFRLSFRGYRFDTEEILRQLMYLGPNVSLTGHEVLCEALRQRLNDAQKYNPEPAEEAN